ncbi:UPF0598 protein CG30010-like [Anneissia japonica]|uniref:UPF0598 protein CG30010-like n=1 Tax=Anneissia japonica TaxID=1529436 RepID=UPI001425557B|nr:UPF0598 protein CG30010-like [Anneissia japonica]
MLFHKIKDIFARNTRASCFFRLSRCITYVQGQSPRPELGKSREYFYYIDHQGQLFLDDAKVKNFITCFKDKKFLAFFFKRLKLNNTGVYVEDFPYVSPCGPELNFVRCDDRPIVYTNIIKTDDGDLLSYNHAHEKLTVEFQPEKLCMLPKTGRVYYPTKEKYGSVALVKSSLAIDFSPHLEFGQEGEYAPPTHFTWKGTRYTLTNDLLKHIPKSDSGVLS